MQTFLAKCSALALIIGGFIFTGDLSRLAERAKRFVNEGSIPGDPAAETPPAGSPTAPAASESAAHAPVAQEPLAQPAMDAPSPNEALDAVQVGGLRPGDRLLVWIARPGTAAGRGPAMRSIVAFDIVDPASGEALEQRHVTGTDGSSRTAVHAVPRRVVIAGSGRSGSGIPANVDPGRIAKGQWIVLAPRMAYQGNGELGPPETVGPVQAMAVSGGGSGL